VLELQDTDIDLWKLIAELPYDELIKNEYK